MDLDTGPTHVAGGAAFISISCEVPIRVGGCTPLYNRGTRWKASIYNSVRYSRSLSGRAFIFFQPLLRRASPVPGLCQGLGGGLSDYPDESSRNPSHRVII
ncbi:hypothetical protein ALC57_08195 [Trachymyrmex cornetzi]|uniref:Uncharacterized protein n=1 Tax=Trachymyrmex cornetzi TaxID=471704 RepID=A0A195E2Q3_9HYME|nr:hypothetical protein ALC57_08195 [Trachymyrmex cornetzi]